MRDDEFEWDDAKAASNYRKHNVTFEQARTAFDDPDCVDRDDPDPAWSADSCDSMDAEREPGSYHLSQTGKRK